MSNFTFLVKVNPASIKTGEQPSYFAQLTENVAGFRWWKSGIWIQDVRFLSLVAQMICLPSRAWRLTSKGGGTISTWSRYWLFHKEFHHIMCLCFVQTHHRWKRWLSKDLELQQWSVPKDITERYVYIFFTSNCLRRDVIQQLWKMSVFPVDGDCQELCDCIFLKVHRNWWVMMQCWKVS